jgi:hypothetical protein
MQVSVTKATKNDNGIQPVFIISVEDPQKVGDPIRSFTMYTVHTRVSLFYFIRSQRATHPACNRLRHLFFKSPPSLSSVATQTSFGSTRRFQTITRVWLSPLYRRRILLVGLMISLCGNADWLWRSAFRRSPTILSWVRMQISEFSWRVTLSHST